MNTLTVPKIRDLVNKPNEQYNDIYATLQKSGHAAAAQTSAQASAQVSASAHASMTEELTQFLNDLKKTPAPTGAPAPIGAPANVKYNNNDSTTPIGELPTSGNYSAY